MSAYWSNIRHGGWTRRNWSGSIRCPVKTDPQNFLPNGKDSSEVKNLCPIRICTKLKFLLMSSAFFVDDLSTIDLTIFQKLEMLTWIPPSTSRIQLLHLRLEEEFRVWAMQSSSSEYENTEHLSACALEVQYQSKFFHEFECSSETARERRWSQLCLSLYCRLVRSSSWSFHNSGFLSYKLPCACWIVLIVTKTSCFHCHISHECVKSVRSCDRRMRSIFW